MIARLKLISPTIAPLSQGEAIFIRPIKTPWIGSCSPFYTRGHNDHSAALRAEVNSDYNPQIQPGPIHKVFNSENQSCSTGGWACDDVLEDLRQISYH
jgi:hypothetical protein